MGKNFPTLDIRVLLKLFKRHTEEFILLINEKNVFIYMYIF